LTAKENFEILLKSYGATPEHRFHPVRKWRFDFAFIPQMIAVEFEGGVFTQGRHSRGVGLSADCDKYNEAHKANNRLNINVAKQRQGETFKLSSKTDNPVYFNRSRMIIGDNPRGLSY